MVISLINYNIAIYENKHDIELLDPTIIQQFKLILEVKKLENENVDQVNQAILRYSTIRSKSVKIDCSDFYEKVIVLLEHLLQ